MRGEFVALDLETTGLDAKTDAIIEFGAVRFKDGLVIAEYSTLVNPGRPLPPEIVTLTGISDRDFLAKPHSATEPPQPAAPFLHQVLPAIQNFVGNAPIIGHNIGFDLGFLYPHGLFQNNLWIDTYDLAAILIPDATRYSLSSLSRQLKIELSEAHRALHDARASALLYWEMWKQLQLLPRDLIHEIAAMSQGLDWNARIIFEYALEEKGEEQRPLPVIEPRHTQIAAAVNIDQSRLKHTDMDDIFGHNGALEKHLPDYERRPGQVQMAEQVQAGFANNQHVMIEAGTGIGKSMAYLVPAIMWARKNGQRVIISTNTLNLQDQLVMNDLPVLHEIMPVPFNAAVLKGRSNYLCLQRLAELRRRRPSSLDEVRVLAKLLVWLAKGGSGEKSNLNIRGYGEHTVWQRLSADQESCTSEQCLLANGGKCPYFQARKAAEAADIIIVNHALLVADATGHNQLIPDYQHLIVDEAHHLEDAATNSLSTRLDENALRYHLKSIAGRHHSLLSDVIDQINSQIPANEGKRLVEFLHELQNAVTAFDAHVSKLFSAFRGLSSRNTADGSIILRIGHEMRQKAEFDPVRQHWIIVREFTNAIHEGLTKFYSVLPRIEKYKIAEFNGLGSSIQAAIRLITFIQQTFTVVIDNTDSNSICWLHLNTNNDISINTAPLRVNTLLNDSLWSTKQSAILTSATLQTNNSFDYLQHSLGTTSFNILPIASPFNYRDSTLVFIPNDMPDPNERGKYQQAVEKALIEVTAALDGRTLALFTSYAQLQQTAQAIKPRLALGDITVYDQLDTSNRQTLLESFKTTEKAILLGTKSFWEGIDIPGAALSALVLTKLPFPIPTDPIISARSETFADPFNEYTIPETILRFRQGFGRLIRKQSDRGIVVILDKRLMSKSYGKNFIDALPDCTIQYGTLQSLAGAAKKWLAADGQ